MKCKVCNGTGVEVIHIDTDRGTKVEEYVCDECGGTGHDFGTGDIERKLKKLAKGN